MKYIDAEELKTELNKRIELLENGDAHPEVMKRVKGVIQGYKATLSIVDSLQQEQENIAERFARIVRGNLIGIDKEVQQKFEQLYFEVTGNKMYGRYND